MACISISLQQLRQAAVASGLSSQQAEELWLALSDDIRQINNSDNFFRQQIAEQAPAESEMFRAMFECAEIGMYLSDLKGTPLSSNRAYRKMLGCETLDLATFERLTHPEDAERDRLLCLELN